MPHTVTISDEAYEYLSQQQTRLGPASVGVLVDSIITEYRDRWQHAYQNEEPTDARHD